MAIKMASGGGGLFPIVNYLSLHNVAKGPCHSPFKLMLSYSSINLIGVISLFVCYWQSLTRKDAVLVTIVAGGRA
jgi:hypothetical protein